MIKAKLCTVVSVCAQPSSRTTCFIKSKTESIWLSVCQGVVFRYFSHTWLCCVSFRFGSDRFFSVRCGGTGRFNCVRFLLGRGDGSFWLGGSVLFGVSILILGVGMDDSSIVRGCDCRQGC